MLVVWPKLATPPDPASKRAARDAGRHGRSAQQEIMTAVGAVTGEVDDITARITFLSDEFAAF